MSEMGRIPLPRIVELKRPNSWGTGNPALLGSPCLDLSMAFWPSQNRLSVDLRGISRMFSTKGDCRWSVAAPNRVYGTLGTFTLLDPSSGRESCETPRRPPEELRTWRNSDVIEYLIFLRQKLWFFWKLRTFVDGRHKQTAETIHNGIIRTSSLIPRALNRRTDRCHLGQRRPLHAFRWPSKPQ